MRMIDDVMVVIYHDYIASRVCFCVLPINTFPHSPFLWLLWLFLRSKSVHNITAKVLLNLNGRQSNKSAICRGEPRPPRPEFPLSNVRSSWGQQTQTDYRMSCWQGTGITVFWEVAILVCWQHLLEENTRLSVVIPKHVSWMQINLRDKQRIQILKQLSSFRLWIR